MHPPPKQLRPLNTNPSEAQSAMSCSIMSKFLAVDMLGCYLMLTRLDEG